MPDMQALSALSPFRSRQSQSQQQREQEYTRLPGSSLSSNESTLSLLPPFSSSTSPSRRASTASVSSSSAGYAYPSSSSGSISPTNSSTRRRTAATFILAFGLGALFVYAISPPSSSSSSLDGYHLDDRLAGLAAPISRLVFHPYAAPAPTSTSSAIPGPTSFASSSSAKGKGKEPTPCNPFKALGQLEHVVGEVDQNLWRPWDPSCAPSTLLTSLRDGEELPWLRNRTVAIIGDSIDRDHIEYFCELARGNMEWVWEGTEHDPGYSYSPGDPARYNSSENEQTGESGGAVQSRPRICRVAAYDLTLVFTFHYGLGDGTDRERQFPHFYPPFRFQDRLSHILVPLLRQLERYPPDLVEVGSGAWDLQHWTLEDREADADRMLALSKERTDWYRSRFTSALQVVEDTFPASRRASADEAEELQVLQSDAEALPLPRSGLSLTRRSRSRSDIQKETALFFREMQHTKLTDSVPPSRVHGLRRLQELLLQTEHRETGGKWQLNNIGQLLLGMEHHYRDAVHPNLYPAGKLWGDMMLYNLKQHVESSESYNKSRRRHRSLTR